MRRLLSILAASASGRNFWVAPGRPVDPGRQAFLGRPAELAVSCTAKDVFGLSARCIVAPKRAHHQFEALSCFVLNL